MAANNVTSKVNDGSTASAAASTTTAPTGNGDAAKTPEDLAHLESLLKTGSWKNKLSEVVFHCEAHSAAGDGVDAPGGHDLPEAGTVDASVGSPRRRFNFIPEHLSLAPISVDEPVPVDDWDQAHFLILRALVEWAPHFPRARAIGLEVTATARCVMVKDVLTVQPVAVASNATASDRKMPPSPSAAQVSASAAVVAPSSSAASSAELSAAPVPSPSVVASPAEILAAPLPSPSVVAPSSSGPTPSSVGASPQPAVAPSSSGPAPSRLLVHRRSRRSPRRPRVRRLPLRPPAPPAPPARRT